MLIISLGRKCVVVNYISIQVQPSDAMLSYQKYQYLYIKLVLHDIATIQLSDTIAAHCSMKSIW